MQKYLLIIFMVVLSATASMAQPVDMATTLRSEGKIYIVVGVMLIIFLGIVVYLFYLDRRIKKLEGLNK